MNYAYPTFYSSPASTLTSEQSRQQLIKAVISFRDGTHIVTEPTQRQLLNQFVQGRLTLDEVVYYLEMNAAAKESASRS
ncbi:MAG: hypothetical protein ACRYG7_00880 [Janthinobacterium lividum]